MNSAVVTFSWIPTEKNQRELFGKKAKAQIPVSNLVSTVSNIMGYGYVQENVQVTLNSLKIMEPRPVGFKEWRDTRTFSNLKSTHCTFIILLILNLVTKKVCVQYLKYKENNNSAPVHIVHNSPFLKNNGEFRQQIYITGGF